MFTHSITICGRAINPTETSNESCSRTKSGKPLLMFSVPIDGGAKIDSKNKGEYNERNTIWAKVMVFFPNPPEGAIRDIPIYFDNIKKKCVVMLKGKILFQEENPEYPTKANNFTIVANPSDITIISENQVGNTDGKSSSSYKEFL